MPSKLTLIIGPMFAGKTKNVIHRVTENTLVIIPKLDIRSAGSLMSHDGASCTATAVSALGDVIPGTMIERVIVDEGQFFDNLATEVAKWLERGLEVVVAGLVTDSTGGPFGHIPTLMHMADEIIHLRAECSRCKGVAPFTKRKVASPNQIEVGGSEKYEPTCRACWFT